MKEYRKIIENIFNYSLKLKAGDGLVVDASGSEVKRFARYVKKLGEKAGLKVTVWFKTKKEAVELWNNISKDELKEKTKADLAVLKENKAYLRVTAFSIDRAGLTEDGHHKFRGIYFKKVHTEWRVNKMQWCVLGFPSREFAKEAGMSRRAYKKFVINNTGMDYSKMDKAMQPLKKLMEITNIVHIKAPGTDLKFSIKRQPAVICSGHKNLPDGEIYCGPVRDSAEGRITYNAKSTESGYEFNQITFVIKKGKIVEAIGENKEKTKALNKILDIDPNARYFGEFAIGVNPHVNRPVGNTLFDEKINGSIHFTPGCCYEDSDNGNVSALHWDLVLVLKKEFGGGEIWFDKTLIQRDGKFVMPVLHPLNRENLK